MPNRLSPRFELMYCARAGSAEVHARRGIETERVPVADVVARRRHFTHPGVYLVRDGDVVVFVGYTSMIPLAVRLRQSIYQRARWAVDDFDGFTVSMIWGGASVEQDAAHAATLIAAYTPRYNGRRGRPRRQTQEEGQHGTT